MRKPDYLIFRPSSRLIIRCIDTVLNWFFRSSRTSFKVVNKILLVVPQRIGDVLLSTAIFPEIEQAFPDADIGIVVGSWSNPVVAKHPSLRWVHIYDHPRANHTNRSFIPKKLRHISTFFSAMWAMRSVGYDVAVILSPFYANGIVLTFFSGIPNRIGFSSGGFGSLLTHSIRWSGDVEHICSAYLRLLSELPGFKQSGKEIQPMLGRAIQPHPDLKDVVIVHPCSVDPRKRWEAKKWAWIIEQLVVRGHSVAVTGKGEGDRAQIDRILSCLPAGLGVIDLSDRLSWADLLRVLRGAKLLVGVDTMIVHMASLFELPTTALYFPPEDLARLYYPKNRHAKVFLEDARGCARGDLLQGALDLLSLTESSMKR